MIAIGCDHGGYALKQEIIEHLKDRGLDYKDYGCYSTEAVDYPVYAKAVANAIVSGECEKGILICGTGIGISITANKIKGSAQLYAAIVSVHRQQENIMMPILSL